MGTAHSNYNPGTKCNCSNRDSTDEAFEFERRHKGTIHQQKFQHRLLGRGPNNPLPPPKDDSTNVNPPENGSSNNETNNTTATIANPPPRSERNSDAAAAAYTQTQTQEMLLTQDVAERNYGSEGNNQENGTAADNNTDVDPSTGSAKDVPTNEQGNEHTIGENNVKETPNAADGENTAAAKMDEGKEEGGTDGNFELEVPEPQQLLAGLEGLREFNPKMQEEFVKVDEKIFELYGIPFTTTMGLILMVELELQKIGKCRYCGCKL